MIVFDERLCMEVELEDDVMGYQVITLDEPITVNSVKFIIMGVYPGSKYNDTCISEIKLE